VVFAQQGTAVPRASGSRVRSWRSWWRSRARSTQAS